jgi:5'(3')-deoxyribonucleotidase
MIKIKQQSKERIGIDLDDVLANFIDALMLYYNQTCRTNIKKEQVQSFSFQEIWGGTLEERIKRVSEFFDTIYFDNMQPIEGSQEAIDILANSNDLFLVTSRSLSVKEKTENWLNEFFKDKFKGIFYSSNHYSKAENSGKTKSQLCSELGISVLIDDSLDYVLQCPPAGIIGILFGDYAWNQNGNLPEGIIRVKNWTEALEILK